MYTHKSDNKNKCLYMNIFLYAVILVLKKNYDGLCNCLPKDSMVTIKRIKLHIPQAVQGVEDQLTFLPPDHANAMIVVLFIKHLNTETDVLSLCDILENIVDDGGPKKFIHTLRSGKMWMHVIHMDRQLTSCVVFRLSSGVGHYLKLLVLTSAN